ncbi:MAG: GAF domain-containing protein [Rikenellaceae bacterium]|nr:GAF domain-containing protein [Rikenellaceae bacterium]
MELDICRDESRGTKDTGRAKDESYNLIYKQIEALTSGEDDVIANMSNIAAILHSTFGFWWTGFYVVKGDELVLGPFQGPIACSRIPFGRGVCGTAWKRKESIVVPDVEQFPGHIACSSLSRSEIVVPVLRGGNVIDLIDIDSKELNTFDGIDREHLERIADLIGKKWQ